MKSWKESPGRLRNPEEKLADPIFESIIPSTPSSALIRSSPFLAPRINNDVERASASATVSAITVAEIACVEGQPLTGFKIW